MNIHGQWLKLSCFHPPGHDSTAWHQEMRSRYGWYGCISALCCHASSVKGQKECDSLVSSDITLHHLTFFVAFCSLRFITPHTSTHHLALHDIWLSAVLQTGSHDRSDRHKRLHHCVGAFASCRPDWLGRICWNLRHLDTHRIPSWSLRSGSILPSDHIVAWPLRESGNQDASKRAPCSSSRALTRI